MSRPERERVDPAWSSEAAPATGLQSYDPRNEDAAAPLVPARIDNPFQRFQTRAYWLGAIIRRSRDAESRARKQPDWFNR